MEKAGTSIQVLRAVFPGEKAFLEHYPYMLSVLPEDEQTRTVTQSRDRSWFFVCGRFLARWFLGRHFGVPPASIEFAQGEKGKPVLAGKWANESIHFNITHSNESIFVAVANAEVGVDIEYKNEIQALEIARRFFHPEEISYIESVDPARLNEEFYRLYVLKEAYVKARGWGIAGNMNQFCVSKRDERGMCLLDGGQWFATPIDPGAEGFWAAVSSRTPLSEIRLVDFSWDEIK